MPASDALLFISSHCPHCPAVLQAMSELVKSGKLGRLEIFNIEQHPEQAIALHIRSVPWIKIGPFELTGLRTQGELQQWIDRMGDDTIMGDYFSELMTSGEIDKVKQSIEKNPKLFDVLLQLMAGDETSLSVLIGVGALMEDFANSELLHKNIDGLGHYTQHPSARVRNDACHYLGLSLDPRAEVYIHPLLTDPDTEVQDTAKEAIGAIQSSK